MDSIRNLIKKSTDFLTRKGVKSPRRVAEELLAFILNKKRIDLYFCYDAPIEPEEKKAFREVIIRKGAKEPLAYIIGSVEFLGLDIKTTPAVLIPRNETEILADLIVKNISSQSLCVWDVCTGTGCLGLAVKKHCPSCKVSLSDISAAALSVAKRNADANQLDVEFLNGDLLHPFKGRKADIIISNPPYIKEEKYEYLEDEVRLYEPKIALVGGLSFYHRLENDLAAFLNKSAQVFMEIGYNNGPEIQEIFSSNTWKNQTLLQDWSGKDRFFMVEYNQIK